METIGSSAGGETGCFCNLLARRPAAKGPGRGSAPAVGWEGTASVKMTLRVSGQGLWGLGFTGLGM